MKVRSRKGEHSGFAIMRSNFHSNLPTYPSAVRLTGLTDRTAPSTFTANEWHQRYGEAFMLIPSVRLEEGVEVTAK